MSKTLRFKCPKCGTVQDVLGNGPCWKCHVMISLPEDGVIWIRRMDDLIFGGGRFRRLTEVYLNGIFLNWLSNNEFIRIPVPYGHYNVLLKHPDRPMANYTGVGLEFDITPNNRVVYLKTEDTVGESGTVILKPATAEEMPPV